VAAEHELREERRVEPDEDEKAAIRPRRSSTITPNIFGHQWCNPASSAITVPPNIT
jgi:hypothetical protein